MISLEPTLHSLSVLLVNLANVPDYPPQWAIDTENFRLIGNWLIYPTNPEEWFSGGAPHIVHHHTSIIGVGELFQATTWH